MSDVEKGSPPHVWRIHDEVYSSNERKGITSTCVENTKTQKVFNRDDEDHLHMCGEYCKGSWLNGHGLGSPPHVWRIRLVIIGHSPDDGITSTCVENTYRCHLLALAYQDHLHMCGEYVIKICKKNITKGSPPHVWRIQYIDLLHGVMWGITSTCVENTGI